MISKRNLEFVAARLGVLALQLAASLALVRILGPADFGCFAVIWALVLIVATFVSFGAPGVLLKLVPFRRCLGEPELSRRELGFSFIAFPVALTTLSVGIGMVAIIFINRLDFSARDVAIVAASGLGLGWFNTAASLHRSISDRAAVLVLRDGLPPFLQLTVAAGLAAAGEATPYKIVLGTTLFLALTSAGLLTRTLRELTITTAPVARPLERAGFMLSGLSGTVSTNLDILLAGFLLSPEAVGIYAFARRLAAVTLFARVAANWQYATGISRALAKRDLFLLHRIDRDGRRFVTALAAFTALVLYAASPLVFKHANIEVTPNLLFLLVVLLAGNLLISCYGVKVVFASQAGLEHFVLFSRILAILLLAAGVAALAIFRNYIDPTKLLILYSLISSLSNTVSMIYVAKIVGRKLFSVDLNNGTIFKNDQVR